MPSRAITDFSFVNKTQTLEKFHELSLLKGDWCLRSANQVCQTKIEISYLLERKTEVLIF